MSHSSVDRKCYSKSTPWDTPPPTNRDLSQKDTVLCKVPQRMLALWNISTSPILQSSQDVHSSMAVIWETGFRGKIAGQKGETLSSSESATGAGPYANR